MRWGVEKWAERSIDLRPVHSREVRSFSTRAGISPGTGSLSTFTDPAGSISTTKR